MAPESDKPCDPQQRQTTPSMEQVFDDVENLLRTALQKDRPATGTEREAVDLYHGTEDSRGKTAALKGACRLGWESFVLRLAEAEREEGPLSMARITGLLIHSVFLRKRRQVYRDEQMAEQVQRANVRGANGEILPFSPSDPRYWEESLKELQEEIAYLLAQRSVKERMVIELSIDEQTGKEVVKQVNATLPSERISETMVSRIWTKFKHDLRRRLDGE